MRKAAVGRGGGAWVLVVYLNGVESDGGFVGARGLGGPALMGIYLKHGTNPLDWPGGEHEAKPK